MEKITFKGLGGCREVGRSSFLIDSGEKFLFDRGIKLTNQKPEYPLDIGTNLDAVIISHAHLDHSGALPELFLDSNFITYMTPPTLDISRLLWYDTIKIAGHEKVPPLFTKEAVLKADRFVMPTTYRRNLDITENANLELFDAGHIPGSALSKLTIKDKSILYTGDFQPIETRLFDAADLNVGEIDTLIIESTYGDRDHPPREMVEKTFIEEVKDGLENGGWVMVPAFAVSRCQELIDILYEYKIDAPIYFDGMGQKASRIFLEHSSYLKNNGVTLRKALEKVNWVDKPFKRKKALKEPCVIVSSAGMLQGGPMLHYLKHLSDNPKNKLLLTGYQVEGTPGRILMDTGKIEIDDHNYKVKAQLRKFDFSAHASQTDLIKTIKKWSPEKILLVHGDEDAMFVFKDKIEQETGIKAIMPELGKTIEI